MAHTSVVGDAVSISNAIIRLITGTRESGCVHRVSQILHNLCDPDAVAVNTVLKHACSGVSTKAAVLVLSRRETWSAIACVVQRDG